MSASKGAIIMGIYLVGMTAIAAGAYGLRDHGRADRVAAQEAAKPVPVDHVDVTMLPSVMDPGVSPPRKPELRARSNTVMPELPRLAALYPGNTRIDDDLASPLSRIYHGAPPVVPPARPLQMSPQAGVQPRDTAPLQASLRPRTRPDGLRPAAPGPVVARLASTARTDETEAAERAQPTALPAAPRIAKTSGRCPSRLARDMPRRPGNAQDAGTVMTSVRGMDGSKRDRHVLREILAGNMPGFLRSLRPVNIKGTAADGTPAEITICVTPDYLALGSDRNFVRVPLGLRAATRIGGEFNMLLPTPRMVDMIYRAADLQLAPSPMSPGPQMTSTEYLLRHNATVEAQRKRAGAAPGTLISGHKKDLVLTNRLASKRGRVAIYGWHRRNGRPIQPLSTVHGAAYADYSHGVRLVSRTAFLNGKPVDLRGLIADPQYAGLLSNEGPVGGPRLRMAALAAN